MINSNKGKKVSSSVTWIGKQIVHNYLLIWLWTIATCVTLESVMIINTVLFSKPETKNQMKLTASTDIHTSQLVNKQSSWCKLQLYTLFNIKEKRKLIWRNSLHYKRELCALLTSHLSALMPSLTFFTLILCLLQCSILSFLRC